MVLVVTAMTWLLGVPLSGVCLRGMPLPWACSLGMAYLSIGWRSVSQARHRVLAFVGSC